MSATSSDLGTAAVDTRSRSKFAATMALAMLLINLVGFGPTLYLRPLFDVPPIPFYLYLHGAAGTAWFALLVVQTQLIAQRRGDIHRRLGWAGVALAAIVLVSGMITSANMVPRNVALGLTSEADLSLYINVTSADNAAFVTFPTLVLLAAFWRRRPDVHRRLMLLGSVTILGPAAARIGSWYGPIPNPIVFGLVFSFLIAMIVHDVWTRRRPHVATVLGVLFVVLVGAGMRVAGVGEALVQQRIERIQSAPGE
jgi:hypothetical protein